MFNILVNIAGTFSLSSCSLAVKRTVSSMVLLHLLQMNYLIVAKPALQSACLVSLFLHVALFQTHAVLGVPAFA